MLNSKQLFGPSFCSLSRDIEVAQTMLFPQATSQFELAVLYIE